MRRRHLLLSGLALALVTGACGGDSADEDSIKIGIIADLTGGFTTYGTSLARSAELAIDEINAAGGIDGRPVEVIIEDMALKCQLLNRLYLATPSMKPGDERQRKKQGKGMI